MSFKSVLLKLFVLLCVVAAVVALSACSFSTIFVVANESNERIQVRYVVKKPTNPYVTARLPEAPAVKLVSELGEQIAWRDLPETRFTFVPETRTAVVTLMPKEALRVEQLINRKCVEEDPRGLEEYSIEEINVIGPAGAIRLTGEQARKSFVPGRKGTCVLTYR